MKVEASLYPTVQDTFRYLEPFTHGSRVWQTDRRIDSLIAYVALHYVWRLWMPLASSATRGSMTVDTTRCTNWTFPNGRSKLWQPFTDVCSTRHRSTMTDCCI